MLIKKLFLFFSFLPITLSVLEAKSSDAFLFGPEDSLHVVVNNRILAKVNGKAISVMDVMKKMDILFYRQFPQYASSAAARFQFYQLNWKSMLQELIDKELILADAEEAKLPVTNGDVRQEMELLFGPNIIANLDKIDMSYEEAWDIIKGDIIIRRLLYFRVNMKAMRKVTPQKVREAYEEFAKNNVRTDEWNYHVVSIRDPDAARGAQVADKVYELLNDSKIPVGDLTNKINEIYPLEKTTVVNVSEPYKHTEKDISTAYKEILVKLNTGEFSKPIIQKSRADKSSVFRIFYLEKMTPGGAIPFNEAENKLKDTLLEEAIALETDKYLEKMKRHYDVQDNFLSKMSDQEFQPFALK